MSKNIMTSFNGKIEKVVDANEFINIITKQNDRIKSSKLILPKLGSNSLGKFKVVFK